MKKILYFVPVALGLLTLASCSDADALFNGADNLEGMTTLKVTENPVGEDIDGITRSYRGEDYTASKYVNGDAIRVYDSKMQKYATFTHNGTIFATPTTDATEGDYAWGVFGADQGEVSYAGWKDGKNVALIKLPAEITYAEQALSSTDATVVYKSALPLWGKVTKVEGQDYAFETTLSRLTAYAKVVLKNGEGGGIQKVRARALRFATAADVTAQTKNVASTPAAVTAANIVAPAEKAAFLTAIKTADTDIATQTATIAGTPAALATALVEDENHPLSGWFEGVLDPETDADGEYNGLLKVSQESSVNTAASSSTITVDVNNKMKNYTSVVYIPIVAAPAPDKYELLVFEYTTDGTTWNVLRTLSDQSITTKQYVQNMTKSYDLSYTENDIETIYQISRYMAKYNKGNGDVILNINATGTTDVATVANTKLPEMYTIYIPELKSGMTVNIGNTTGTGSKVDLTNYQLVIADAEGVTDFTKPVTLNFAGGFAAAAKNIKVVTKRPITLAGDFSALTYSGNDIIASETSALTLGRAADATAGITALNFKANEVELKKGVAADNNINPDDLLPVAAEEAAVGSVTINNMVTNGSKIVNTDGVEITVNSGTVDEIDVNKFAAQTINVKGGKVSTITAAGIAQASVTSNLTVTVNTEGNAEITTLTAQDNGATGAAKREVKYALSATATAATTATGITPQANIYTAAQLLAVASYTTSTAAKLCTDITVASDATWASVTPVNMSSFDGQNHKITGLNAPLFATLANNVSNLTLENASIAKDAANQGVLAGTVTVGADITISKVNVKNSTVGAATNLASSTYNIGGLIGQANVTAANKLTIEGCQITGTVKGYYNLGGYIGNVNATAAGTVAFTKDNNTTKLGNDISFLKSYWTTDATDTHCGTVGNFIGSITGSAALVLKIGGTNAGKDDSFGMFFTENKITNTAVVDNTKATEGWLEFARNVNASKVYKGMENQLIGYSTGTIATGTTQATATGSTIFGKFNMKDGELVAAGTTGAAAITAANYINIFGDAE